MSAFSSLAISAVTFGCVLVLCESNARANQTIRLEFDVEDAPVPDNLCIITTTGDPKEDIWESRGGGRQQGPAGSSIPLEDLLLFRSAPAEDGDLWTVRSNEDLTSGLLGEKFVALESRRPFIAAALQSLALTLGPESSIGCGDETLLPCRPRFVIPEHVQKFDVDSASSYSKALHLRCVANIRKHALLARTAVVFVNPHQAEAPAVVGVELDGSVASIRFNGEVSEHEGIVAAVVGGHYVTSRSFSSVNGRVVLPLASWCAAHDVTLPPASPGIMADIRVEFTNGAGLTLSCTPTVASQQFSMMLPRDPPPGGGSITVQGQPSDHFYLRTSWTRGEPPRSLVPQVLSARAFLDRDCFHAPEEACPSARIGAIQCATVSATAESCDYVCTTTGVGVHLPTSVTFIRPDTGDRWMDTMATIGQRFVETVPQERRSLRIDASAIRGAIWDWKADVDDVEVVLPGGEVRRFTLAELGGTEIKYSNVRCGEPIVYRYLNPRTFVDQVAIAKNGAIRLDLPLAPVRDSGALRVGASAAYAWAIGTNPPGPAQAAGLAEMDLLYRPAREFFQFGWGFAVMYGNRLYGIGEGSNGRTGTLEYLRFLAAVSASIRFRGVEMEAQLRGGINFGLGRLPADFAPGVSEDGGVGVLVPGAGLHIWLTGPFWLRLAGAGVVGERFLTLAGSAGPIVKNESRDYAFIETGIELLVQ